LAIALNTLAPVFGTIAIIMGSSAKSLDSTKGSAGIICGIISFAMFIILIPLHIGISAFTFAFFYTIVTGY
jgi:hypothetical protein